MDFADFFRRVAGMDSDAEGPHPWQVELAAASACHDRLIRIPTGFGKTLGVLAAWLWNLRQQHAGWPRRLVWCLPMRTLVEQTAAEAEAALRRLHLLREGGHDAGGRIGVHLLMGGADAGEWQLLPDQAAVLIGTQDMLLSRALNRGYGAPRARWPLEFGLLNQDCLWVMDEVQLMDVGLATSGQLQAFRRQDEDSGKSLQPCRSWWMSATLQRAWLAAGPETRDLAASLPQDSIPPEHRVGPLWLGVAKPREVAAVADTKELAKLIARAHLDAGRGRDGPTLVVVNRVDRAVELRALLGADSSLAGTDLRLVHSRFRPQERAHWRGDFLNRAACAPGTDRIIVATQVIEAGVDLSAAVLVTENAPWPSLVQRFGRAARWGGSARIIVTDCSPKDDKAAAPYAKAALDAALEALALVSDVAPLALEQFEADHPDRLSSLYPYQPRHLLLRHEIEELFDTSSDLSGADIDISRFIRSGDERDLQVFWEHVEADAWPAPSLKPMRAALCAVPFLAARDWLCGKESGSARLPRLASGKRAWVWDYLDHRWRVAERRDLNPGQTVLVAAQCGGYDPLLGWQRESRKPVIPVDRLPVPAEQLADAAEDDESLSIQHWQTIAWHGRAVGVEGTRLAGTLVPGKATLFDLGGRWHDLGKAHPAFNGSIRHDYPGRPQRPDLAKAPRDAWLQPARLYPDARHGRRAGFRHELASTIALFEVLARHRPDHPALLGPWRNLLDAAGLNCVVPPAATAPPNPLELEILDLSAEDFDLLAYLVCSHHGKVRLAWHASPLDQAAEDAALRIRGIRSGDTLPEVLLAQADGHYTALPACTLRLDAAALGLNGVTGRGWTERVLDLLQRHGPFALAYLEALLRIADQSASRFGLQADPLLAGIPPPELSGPEAGP